MGDAFLRVAFKGLNETVPVLIQQQTHLADAVLVYDNDSEASAGTHVAVRVVRAGTDSSETLAFARGRLELPPANASADIDVNRGAEPDPCMTVRCIQDEHRDVVSACPG